MHRFSLRPAALRHVPLALALVVTAWAAHAGPSVELVVQPGDSLDSLSRTLLRPSTGWRELARLNGLSEPYRLQPGQALRIPVALLRQTAAPASARAVTGDVVWMLPSTPGGRAASKHGSRADVPLEERPAAPVLPLQPGQLLPEGAVVMVGARGSAVLQLAEGSQIKLLPDSVASLSQARMAGARAAAPASPVSAVTSGASDTVQDGWFVGSMRLLRGSLEVLASKVMRAKPLEVQTPTTVLGVRGTHYRVHLDAPMPGDAVCRSECGPPPQAGEAAGSSPSRPPAWITIAEVLEGRVATGPRLVLAAGQGARVSAGQPPEVRPLPPAPDLSALPARFERPLVSWPAPADSAVRVQVAADADFERVWEDRFVAAGAPVRIDGLPDGLWHVRMRRVDAEGVAGVDAVGGFELAARPEPPPTLAPRPESKHPAGAVKFAWAASEGVDRYALQVARDAAFSDPVTAGPLDVPGTELTLELPQGRYHWRVRGIAADGHRGPWGDARTFEVRPDPLPPQQDRDADGSLVLTWGSAPSADVPVGQPAVRYQAELAADPGFTQIISRLDLDQPQWRLPPPRLGRAVPPGVAAEGPAYFRYRTIEPDGYVSRPSQTVRIDLPRDPVTPWLLLAPLLLGL